MASFPPASSHRFYSNLHHERLANEQPLELTFTGGIRVAASALPGAIRRPLDPQGGGTQLAQTIEFTIDKDLLKRKKITLAANVTKFTCKDESGADCDFTVREVFGGGAHQTFWHCIASRRVRPS